jgi:hypothetical protein
MDELLPEIQRFLRRTGLPESKFGRLAVKDPRRQRVQQFMATYPA